MTTKAPTTLDDLRLAVEPALDRALPPEDAWPETIHRAARYSLFAGGKRIRPVLVLAAGEDHDVETAQAVEGLDPVHDLRRRALSLHAGRIEEHLEVGVAAAQHPHDVADHRPRG